MECSICLEQIKNIYYLDCGHYFHYQCIKDWMDTLKVGNYVNTKIKIQRQCPICRQGTFIINPPRWWDCLKIKI